MGRRATPGIRRLAVLASILATSVLAPGAAQHAVRAADATTLTIGISPEPDTLDPQVTGTAIASTVDSYIGDTLVALDPKSKIVPDLAKSYSVSSDGMTYTFNLRQDVTFQDGTPLDAAAYVATFKRLLDPATKAAVQAGRVGQVSAVTATGKYSFTITLKQPYAFLLYNLTDSNFAPLSPTALKGEGTGFGRKPVSTGPWQVQDWATGSQIVLVKNPNYRWGPAFLKQGPPSINKIVFRILNNPASATDALQAGEVDGLYNMALESVPRVQSSGQYTILKALNAGARFLEFNATQPPFTDVRVRQALNYAINKQEVVQVAINGLGVPLYGVLSPVMYGYWSGIKTYRYSYDPQKALALLAQAGYVKTGGVLQKSGKPLTFTVLTTDDLAFLKKSALVVQDQLKQLGITVNIQSLQFATEIATIHKGGSQADFMGYNYPIPDIFFIWFHSSQVGVGFNDSFYKDPRLDALIVKMRSTVDNGARNALIAQLERYVSDKALMVPLFDEYNYTALQPRVKNMTLDPRGRLVLQNATLG